MLHQMKLKRSPFEKIKDGSKTIELRLYDEKRQKVKIGDFIEFTCLDDATQKIPKEKFGYHPGDTPDPNHMDDYYTREDQEKYGVLGIELYCTDLQKFIDAQDNGYSFGETYATALSEMKQGCKVSHWIWYVFPQIQGLGRSGTTAFFSIHDLTEAKDYYAHPVLGTRQIEICEVLLNIESDDPMCVFGYPDAFKVRSCMTLFKHAAPEQLVFQRVLDKFCQGNEDGKTLKILGR